MKFYIALLILMSVLACGLLNKDKKDSSEDLKKKELELKERELALKEKKEKEEQIMREREERLSREQEDLSSRKEYVEREEREKKRNRDDRSRTNRRRNESDYSDYQPGLYPEASTRYLTYGDVKNKSRWQLKIMRNEIYARYGYIFKTKDMKNYFNRQSWYNPVYNDVSSQLTSLEKKNIAYIKKFE